MCMTALACIDGCHWLRRTSCVFMLTMWCVCPFPKHTQTHTHTHTHMDFPNKSLHTHLNIHAWLHVKVTIIFLSFLFTGEARNIASFFEHSYPSECMPASVGNKLYSNPNCTFITLSSSAYIAGEMLSLINPIKSRLCCCWGPCWTFSVAVLGNSLES